MAKFAPDAVMDGACAVIALADEMYITNAQPVNYADLGVGANIIVGPIALTPGDGNGDFVIGNGLVSGRRVDVTAQAGASIIATDDATHVVLATGGATDLLRYVTTCALQTLTSGGTVDIGTWGVEFRAPTP